MSVFLRWRTEKTAAWLSEAVADAEPDKQKAQLFRDLSDAAEEQAAIIAEGMSGNVPVFKPSLRARIVEGLIQMFGPRAIRPVLAAIKVRGLSVYSGSINMGKHVIPTTVGEIGRRHARAGSGSLRAAVFGINDGLVSNTCLVMGVAGAGAAPNIVLLSGVAGLLAGAFSMASGEYISMLTQREMFEYQIAEEREELDLYPAEEAEELALIYAARGLPIEDARHIATRLIEDPEKALDTLAREELGLNPDELGSPWGAAIYSFVAFAVGAVLPLFPFLFGPMDHSILTAGGLSGSALFVVGAALSLFTGRNAMLGGVRMLLIGAMAAMATYTIGGLFNGAV